MRASGLGLLLCFGCGGSGDALPCRQGFFPAPDGHCYPPPEDPAPPSATEVIDGIADCVPLKPTGEVEIDGGCVEGACAGDTWDEVKAELGDDVSCSQASWSDQWRYCTWDDRIQGLFPDEDRSGAPDGAGRTDWLRLTGDYRGATVDGLGLGQSPRCWTDQLGVPTTALWVDSGGALFLEELVWDSYGVYLYDAISVDGAGTPDGRVDDVYLFGAP